MNAHVAELQAAVKSQTLPWVAFPDRPEAYAVGVHGDHGYVLEVRPLGLTRYWNWLVSTGKHRAGVVSSAVEALDAANEEYARFAAELHEAGAA
jgi:hypothetical protein